MAESTVPAADWVVGLKPSASLISPVRRFYAINVRSQSSCRNDAPLFWGADSHTRSDIFLHLVGEIRLISSRLVHVAVGAVIVAVVHVRIGGGSEDVLWGIRTLDVESRRSTSVFEHEQSVSGCISLGILPWLSGFSCSFLSQHIDVQTSIRPNSEYP